MTIQTADNASLSLRHRMAGQWRMGWVWMLSLVLWACQDQTVFKENVDFMENKWYIKSTPTFSFEIEDPTVSYNLYYNVRNGLAYPYYNLYVTRYLYDAKGQLISSKLDELLLADAITGKPLGSGLGDMFDHKVLAMRQFKFPTKGKYTFKIAQYMRQNPLPEVVSVGLSVEKVP
jgi:gliding motility-associated lipoprotein GldH